MLSSTCRRARVARWPRTVLVRGAYRSIPVAVAHRCGRARAAHRAGRVARAGHRARRTQIDAAQGTRTAPRICTSRRPSCKGMHTARRRRSSRPCRAGIARLAAARLHDGSVVPEPRVGRRLRQTQMDVRLQRASTPLESAVTGPLERQSDRRPRRPRRPARPRSNDAAVHLRHRRRGAGRAQRHRPSKTPWHGARAEYRLPGSGWQLLRLRGPYLVDAARRQLDVVIHPTTLGPVRSFCTSVSQPAVHSS